MAKISYYVPTKKTVETCLADQIQILYLFELLPFSYNEHVLPLNKQDKSSPEENLGPVQELWSVQPALHGSYVCPLQRGQKRGMVQHEVNSLSLRFITYKYSKRRNVINKVHKHNISEINVNSLRRKDKRGCFESIKKSH